MANKVQRRRSIRLKNYDYSQNGAYFITVCTQDRACLFGEIADANMQCNAVGQMATSEWLALPERFSIVRLDEFVIMPNHIHGILWIVGSGPVPNHDNRATVGVGLVPTHDNRATTRVAPTANTKQTATTWTGHAPAHAPTIGDIVGAFKSLTTVDYIRGVKTSGWPAFRERLWQHNYYEHIIRDDESLNRIRQYILDNPTQWAMDRENPMNAGAANNADVWAGLVPTRNPVPACDRATVGAGLVPAHNPVPACDRATTRVAPTANAQRNTATVGAGLVPALMKGQNHGG